MAQISFQNIDKVKVDELSDTQLAQFVNKYTEKGYTLADVERMAKAKNMPAAELEKLKYRINSLETNTETAELVETPVVNLPVTNENTIKSRIYGASLFSQSKVSFEPSQSMPTPRNYMIGANDVLHVDVYGMAEATFDLTVSSEGNVRIPNVGLVQVSGMTIESAEKVIKKKLSSVYNSINSGHTSVSVTVNRIRSIKVYIMGEVKNPGSYTLTSVSSVFNAMNACGGPSDNGSMRAIKLLRNGKEIACVDFYEFLMRGVMPSDITLQDQDVIQVPPYENRVTVNGAVKRDGIYELKKGETLQNLLDYCGGFAEDAYMDRISVTRNENGEKSVADVTKEIFRMFMPISGDVYQIDKILEKYTNRVQILGNVFRPGTYALEDNMSLRDLVTKANGLTEDAFMESATVVRLQDDLTPEIVSFNVKDLMDGKFNLLLKKEDIVTIGGKNDFESEKKISVYGAVLAPGTFPYYENATLKDVMFLSRGFRDDADPTKIEVVRIITDDEVLKNNDIKTQVFALSLDRELSGADAGFKLEPKDIITVRRKEGYEQLGTVQVLGEVKLPGTFAITRKTERISDMIARASGLSQYAYPEGAFLIRSSHRSEAEKRRDLELLMMLKNADNVTNIEDVRREIESRQDLVGIKLEKILNTPGSETDLNVEAGDIIFVPKTMQTVTIAGAVQVPGMEVYSGPSLRKYIRGAGGFEKKARKSGVYVAYSNGKIKSTRHILWVKNYPPVKPGSHIFIPNKPEKNDDGKANATFFVSLFSSIATMGSVVVTAISVISK
ncbi:MAG: SLBB domain-containing protein [Paludibacteraceae bacterium]|nr:SLBB domain-containing protein [Paludibacteraceae bacterium]